MFVEAWSECSEVCCFTTVFPFKKIFWSNTVAVWVLRTSVNLASGVAGNEKHTISSHLWNVCPASYWSLMAEMGMESNPPEQHSVVFTIKLSFLFCLQHCLLTPCSIGNKWGMDNNLHYSALIHSCCVVPYYTLSETVISQGRWKCIFVKIKTDSRELNKSVFPRFWVLCITSLMFFYCELMIWKYFSCICMFIHEVMYLNHHSATMATVFKIISNLDVYAKYVL